MKVPRLIQMLAKLGGSNACLLTEEAGEMIGIGKTKKRCNVIYG